MYAYIKGTYMSRKNDSIVIECNQIGYEIRVASTIMEHLPSFHDEVKIYTYLHIREDAQLLYGFLTEEEKEIFQLLIGVSGIGPKGALSILSVLSCEELKFAVLSGDVKAISKAPGVGSKTAQRLLIELKDKIDFESTISNSLSSSDVYSVSDSGSSKSEAIAALVSLGYSPTEATRSVQQVHLETDATVEDYIKQALKQLTYL